MKILIAKLRDENAFLNDMLENAHNRSRLLEQQLQQAHRAAEESAKDAHRRGWEQAKREAQQALCEICCYNSADNPVPDECTTCNESRAIASMSYDVANSKAALEYKGGRR